MTKDIDPLVEMVAIAIRVATLKSMRPEITEEEISLALVERADVDYREEARAAIAVVLEWYSERNNVSEEMAQAWRYVGDVSDDDWDDPQCVAAAMVAELKRRQG